MKDSRDRTTFMMVCDLLDDGRVDVITYDVHFKQLPPMQERFGYSKQRIKAGHAIVDIRKMLIGDLATWLARQGAWEDQTLPF